MGKLADAIASSAVKKGPVCDTGNLLDVMDQDDAADLTTALKDKGIAATIIQAKLDEFGYQVGVTSLRRHRNRLLGKGDACSCDVD